MKKQILLRIACVAFALLSSITYGQKNPNTTTQRVGFIFEFAVGGGIISLEDSAGIQTPILVLKGQCDFLSYAVGYEYVDLYPSSQFILIKNAGHEIWYEQKEAYVKNIIEFIDE